MAGAGRASQTRGGVVRDSCSTLRVARDETASQLTARAARAS